MAPSQHRHTWRARLADAFAARSRSYHDRRVAWRTAGPIVFVLAGLLFVTSAVSSGGTDLRAGRFTDLDGLANSERQQVETLRTQAAGLTKQVNGLTEALSQGSSKPVQRQIDALKEPSGLRPVSGPGVTITLTDAPESVQRSVTSVDVSQLLVHQQDIQAVANALWAGGAEAMTIHRLLGVQPRASSADDGSTSARRGEDRPAGRRIRQHSLAAVLGQACVAGGWSAGALPVRGSLLAWTRSRRRHIRIPRQYVLRRTLPSP